MNRFLEKVALACILVMLFPKWGNCASSDDVDLTIAVSAINEVAISQTVNPIAIAMTGLGANSAGQLPADAVPGAGAVTYGITTNCATNKGRLTGSLNTAMPTNLDLVVNAAAPNGGTAVANQAFGNTDGTDAKNLVTAIDAVAEGNLAITFKLKASSVAVPPIPPSELSAQARIFTVTLAIDPP